MTKEGKVKKPIYKRWWVWVLAVIIVFAIFSGGDESDLATETEAVETSADVESAVDEANVEEDTEESPQEPATEEEATEEEVAEEESVSREFRNALTKAEQYAKSMHMSKAGIYDQLTSEYGENFPEDAAQYAIDTIEHDWKENALEKAKQYADMMAMSDSAIYDQLVSDFGEKFTPEEAQYAIDNLD